MKVKSSSSGISDYEKYINYFYISLGIGRYKLDTKSPVIFLDMSFDTSSNYSYIPSILCDYHCHTKNLYDNSLSDDFRKSELITNYSYNKGFVEGYEANDTIFLDSDNNLPDLRFLLSKYDYGFKGLNYSGSLSLITFSEYLYQESQANNLKNNLEKYVFLDLNYNSENKDSVITFFGIPPDRKVHYKSFLFNQWNLNDFSITLEKIKIYAKILDTNSTKVKIDISTPYIHIPFSDMAHISKAISQEYFRKCGFDKSKMFYCILTDNHNNDLDDFPNIQIKIGDNWFQLINSEYIVIKTSGRKKVYAYFPIIVSNDESYWVLGNTFLNSHFMILDFSGQKIGLLPKKNANISAKTYSSIVMTVVIILLSIFVLIKYKIDSKILNRSIEGGDYSEIQNP